MLIKLAYPLPRKSPDHTLVAPWLHGHGRCARGRGRRARTPPRRTEHAGASRLFMHPISQRNCLENSWTGLDHVFLATPSADKGAFGPVMPPRRASELSPFGFSKHSRKSRCEILHSHGPMPHA